MSGLYDFYNYVTTKTASFFREFSVFWCVNWFYSVPVTEVKCHQILMNKDCRRDNLYHRGFLSVYSTLHSTSVKCHVDKHNLCLPSVLRGIFCTNFVSKLPSRTYQNSHLETFLDCPRIRIFLYQIIPPLRDAAATPGPPHRGFTITLRHTTFGRTPLEEWSARRRYLYLTTQNTHKT
jgi:hypothetical protein